MSGALPFGFHIPTRIVFRTGAINDLADLEEVSRRRCMLFSYAGFSRTDIVETLQNAASEMLIVDEFEENPSDELARQLVSRTREFGAETMVAIGGGSSIDLAKAVAWFDANPTYTPGQTVPPNPTSVAIVAVPTTAGTGSEVSPFTVLTDGLTHKKWFVKHTSIIPRVALLDPELTLTVPRRVTAHTGIDALSHAVEGYLTTLAGGMLEPLALDACRRVREDLPCALDTPNDIDSRASLLLASLEGGIILATCGTVVVHALGYQLTKAFGYRHGEVNALMLGTFVERLAQRGSDRAQQILRIFDGDLTAFIRSCGIEPDCSIESVSPTDLETWIDAGWSAYGRRNAVMPLERDDVRAILLSAFR